MTIPVNADAHTPPRQRPPLRSWTMRVVDSFDVAPNMRRVVLTAADIDEFAYKPGQALVLMVPLPERRDGTARLHDPHHGPIRPGTISIDFVLHGDTPAPDLGAISQARRHDRGERPARRDGAARRGRLASPHRRRDLHPGDRPYPGDHARRREGLRLHRGRRQERRDRPGDPGRCRDAVDPSPRLASRSQRPDERRGAGFRSAVRPGPCLHHWRDEQCPPPAAYPRRSGLRPATRSRPKATGAPAASAATTMWTIDCSCNSSIGDTMTMSHLPSRRGYPCRRAGAGPADERRLRADHQGPACPRGNRAAVGPKKVLVFDLASLDTLDALGWRSPGSRPAACPTICPNSIRTGTRRSERCSSRTTRPSTLPNLT